MSILHHSPALPPPQSAYLCTRHPKYDIIQSYRCTVCLHNVTLYAHLFSRGPNDYMVPDVSTSCKCPEVSIENFKAERLKMFVWRCWACDGSNVYAALEKLLYRCMHCKMPYGSELVEMWWKGGLEMKVFSLRNLEPRKEADQSEDEDHLGDDGEQECKDAVVVKRTETGG